MAVWAAAVVAGIPPDLFWDLTAREVEAVLELRLKDTKATWKRSAFLASVIVNVNRRKGSRPVTPDDFFKPDRREEDYLSVDDARQMLDSWAKGTQKRSKVPPS